MSFHIPTDYISLSKPTALVVIWGLLRLAPNTQEIGSSSICTCMYTIRGGPEQAPNRQETGRCFIRIIYTYIRGGWSRFLRNGHLIIVDHNMQCIIFADSAG